jgi:valyl-tRNA synthetase
MILELDKAYDASKHEADIYQKWLESGFFNPDNLDQKGEPFTIIMPPPNANAPMHVGHALGLTIQDILIRWQRMSGRRALYLPGTDHAGFETQVVFEKKLDKEGRSRFGMEREEFYKEIWDFVQSNKHLSEESIKRLGMSCDWSRNTFTLDPEIVKVVYETFQKMHEDGLVYRAGRICNWCVKHQTNLADLETKYEEREDPFYYFQYGPFVIGTARPETKFGDKYVVMHPSDERYAEYKHGQTIEVEWINGPVTATVIKDEAIDMEFGSGVMTITPWHDATDFEIAKRHDLDYEQIIDLRGKLLPIAGEFEGMKISEARPKIVEKLKAKGLLLEDKTESNYKHNVQVCYKCSNLIEPQVIDQWYIAMTKELPDGHPSLRDMAVAGVKNGEVKIPNSRFEKTFFHWMENIRDWPISRQIWWGIPIPAKYCGDCNEVIIDINNSLTSCKKCGSGNLTADQDTFDTWFSSGQWPYATMMANDAKHNTKDLDTYFPTQVMETGWDILFFWVARMMMLSYYRTGKAPFQTVFLHGLVRDKDRQKMSKSKGNVVDPLGVIDTYGADSLRFALIFSTAAGNDIPLAEEKIKGMKHFGNKLWNIARFVLNVIPEATSDEVARAVGDPSLDSRLRGNDSGTDADKLILEQLAQASATVTTHLENFRIHEAAQTLYDFVWKEFADVYIEASKVQLQSEEQKQNTQAVLLHVLIETLKLLHPFMPFVTEVIWQKLVEAKLVKEKLLMGANWPK